jgi:GT2 family glycosyltransferase
MEAATSSPAAAPAVTTVVMTRNRCADLLTSLARQTGPVIVVDNGSQDDTVERVRALPDNQIRLVALERNIGAPARNIGVRSATTPYVAFADDDSWWAPGSLDRAARLFAAHPRLGLVAGRVTVGPAEVDDPVCAQMAAAALGHAPDLPGPDILGFLACGAIVRREAFLAAGGFDDVVRFPGEEERLALDLAAAGWGLSYVPDIVARHHPSPARGSVVHRTRQQTRSALLTAVMRRPLTVAARRARDAASGSRGSRLGLLHALPDLPRALAERRPLPPLIEQRAARLDPQSSTREPRST